jgi:hypothetical protein
MDAETRRVLETGDPLTSMWREVVGSSVQLRVPLRDPIDLRRCALILRELANRFEVLSHDKRSADSVMFEAKHHGKVAQARLTSKIRRA